ncbi:MAG: hypothetical protein QW484_03345 [Candidatus Pacearchaeota archaeon]
MKKFVKGLLSVLGLASLLYLSVPKTAEADVTFEGWVKGTYAKKARVCLKNAYGDSTVAIASFYLPKLDAYYWSKTTNIVDVNDTCWLSYTDSLNSGKRQDIWTIVHGINRIITANLDKNLWNYSVDVTNVTDGIADTLIKADLRIKHQGRWSDAVCDTFNTAHDYDDISLNAAKSESVQVWTNYGTNPNAILNDSIEIVARSLNNPAMVGTSRGIVRRVWNNFPYGIGHGSGWGDHLPDIVLQVGVPEDKSEEKNLESIFKPTIIRKGQNIKFDYDKIKELTIYDETGRQVVSYNSEMLKHLVPDFSGFSSGVYFWRARVREKERQGESIGGKFVVVE